MQKAEQGHHYFMGIAEILLALPDEFKLLQG